MVKVSISIPTYNRADYLQYAVNSVLQQTYQDFELIICDDGSTDNTPQLVNSWNDPRIRYLRHPQNIGRSCNMRSGFDAALGEYFIKFDDDDALTPEFLSKTVAILESNPAVDFVCSDHWIINAQGKREEAATQQNSAKWGKNKLSAGIINNLIAETFIHQSLQVGSTLFRRNCLASLDYMRPEADGCEDFDLLVRVAIARFKGYFLPELLMEYRFHGGQTSLRQDIHFLSAKAFCIDSYSFKEPELEAFRLKKLATTKQGLGLRLIEKGETKKGRKLLQQSLKYSHDWKRIYLGLFLSYLPLQLRQFFIDKFRNSRPKDYSEQVREITA
ncbi:MAG: glycosyltransferase [Pleurocapsa sp.]